VSAALDRLAVEIAAALGVPEVEGLEALSGGASRETWAFRAKGADGAMRDLILRRDPPGATRGEGAIDRATEAAVIDAAGKAGAPAPKIVRSMGPNAFVMERLAGETDPRRIFKEARFAPARARFAEDCGLALARIRRASPAALPNLPALGADAQLALYRATLDRLGATRPVFELAMRWLLLNMPEPVAPALVHGDFRMGNLLIGETGLIAALDWELAHLGDPAEDLGWLCVRSWRFGGAGAVGGLGARETLLAAHDGGVDAARLRYWEIFGTFKWGVICLIQAERHLSGREVSLEHAAIGRRASETEYDLMNMLR